MIKGIRIHFSLVLLLLALLFFYRPRPFPRHKRIQRFSENLLGNARKSFPPIRLLHLTLLVFYFFATYSLDLIAPCRFTHCFSTTRDYCKKRRARLRLRQLLPLKALRQLISCPSTRTQLFINGRRRRSLCWWYWVRRRSWSQQRLKYVSRAR